MESISQLGVVSHADDLSLDDVVSMSDLDSLSHGVIHSVMFFPIFLLLFLLQCSQSCR